MTYLFVMVFRMLNLPRILYQHWKEVIIIRVICLKEMLWQVNVSFLLTSFACLYPQKRLFFLRKKGTNEKNSMTKKLLVFNYFVLLKCRYIWDFLFGHTYICGTLISSVEHWCHLRDDHSKCTGIICSRIFRSSQFFFCQFTAWKRLLH